MEPGVSITKGVFVYKAAENKDDKSTKKADKKKRKRKVYDSSRNVTDNSEQLNINAYSGEVPSESEKHFHILWSKMLDEISKVTRSVHAQLLEQLASFAKSSAVGSLLPAACVLTGVNVPDHDDFFLTVANCLKKDVTPLVCILRSKDCTNLKRAVQTLSKQILTSLYLDFNDFEMNIHRDDCCLSYVSVCYRNKFRNSDPNDKSGDNSKNRTTDSPPIVVIVQDLESFVPSIIDDLVVICSQYANDVNMKFVFGIATATSAIKSIIPHGALSHLQLYSYRSEPATVLLNNILENILLTDKHPFKLNGKVFRLLLDRFLYHDFSISNFTSSVKFCMMEHFHNEKLAILCCDKSAVNDVVDTLTPSQLESCRRLPSFMNYVEQQESSVQKKLLLDDIYFRGVLVTLIEKLHAYHRRLLVLSHTLMMLAQNLPGCPLGKQIREFYGISLEGKITECEGFEKTMKLLSMSSADELTTRISAMLDVIRKLFNDDDDVIKDLRRTLSEFYATLNEFMTVDKHGKETDLHSVSPKDSVADHSSDKPAVRYTYQLQEQIKAMKKKNKMPNDVSSVRVKLMSYLKEFYREYLISCETNPYHELYYYSDVSSVRCRLMVSPRAALHKSLTDPASYLNCVCCRFKSDDKASIPSSLPDVCIVYKLLQECGRLVNLYDWLQAFNTIVSGEESSSKPTKHLQVRFIQAVSELQFLGYVKPTRKKTDHMSRLTWT